MIHTKIVTRASSPTLIQEILETSNDSEMSEDKESDDEWASNEYLTFIVEGLIQLYKIVKLLELRFNRMF